MKTPPKRCIKGEAHHWLMPPPNGPTLTGTCKKCGKTFDGFRNTFDYSNWYHATRHGKKAKKNVSVWDRKQRRANSKKQLSKLS